MAGPPVRRVEFFAIDRLDEGKPPFSASNVLAKVAALNRESGEAYLKHGFFNRMLGLVHAADEPQPMFSLWNVDTVNSPSFERKGSITVYDMMEDEGVTFPAFAMFFDDQVMALLRPSPQAAGQSKIAEYLNHFGEASCVFAALTNPDILRQLQRPADEIVNTKLRIRLANLPRVGEVNKDVEAALTAAVGPSNSTEIGVTWKVRLKKDRAPWWASTRPVLRQLVESGVVDLFETASVTTAGGVPVDLLHQQLTERVEVDLLPGEKNVKPEAAAEALRTAYSRRKDDLKEAYGLR